MNKNQIKKHKLPYNYEKIFESIFFILISISIVINIVYKNTEGTFSSILTLVTIIIPRYILKKSSIKVSSYLYLFVLLFIFLSMFLGKILGFYYTFPRWDKMLHILSGFILVLIGFVMFFILSKKDMTGKIPSIVIVLFALFFSVAMAGVWEIFEFTTDSIFGFTSQNESLLDTMGDIISGTVGAIIASILGYLHLKGRSNRLFTQIIDYTINENNHIIK